MVNEKHEEKIIKGFNEIRDHEHLKQIIDGRLKNFVDLASLKISFNDKIFKHEDEDKRVTFTQMNNFFERFHDRKL